MQILKAENLHKWDPDDINLESVANLPLWCQEPDNVKSPAAFQRTLNKWNFIGRVRGLLREIRIPFLKQKREATRNAVLTKLEVIQQLQEPPPTPPPTKYIDVHYWD